MAKKKLKGEKSAKVPESDSALIVGAGMAGLRAALDLAEAGYSITLIDQQPHIGGILMQLDRQFPTNDCGMCKMLPTMMRDEISECCIRRNLSHPNIEILTNSTVDSVIGDVGAFSIKIHRSPQFVDPQKCITCGKCEQVCPVEVPNEFNDKLDTRKAIFTPYPLPNPNTYTLDIVNCTKCNKCVEVCPTAAIDLKATDTEVQIKVGSIILAPGLQVFNPEPCRAYGYGNDPNILTSIDFERIYSGLGPYSDKRILVRPSDQKIPKNLAFIQCVGSRNARIGHEYCSYACCMYSLKEAILAKEQNPEIDVSIFYMDIRAFGKGYHEYYQQAKNMGINFIRCRVPAVQPKSETENLEVTIVTESGEPYQEEFELVVLGVGLEAPRNANELAEVFGIKLNEYNFSSSEEFTPLTSSRAGVYVCGGFTGPKDIPETVTEASAAAALAARNLAIPKPEKAVEEPRVIPESVETMDTESEDPIIGVLLCSCGAEMDSTIDMAELEKYSKNLADVAIVETIDYLCLKPEEIKTKLEASGKNLNRLIIAACTPYRFELKFKTYAQQAGINPAWIEILNLRERLAWACGEDKSLMTSTAKHQLAIAYEKLNVKAKLPMEISQTPVAHRALVVGGGIAGMVSANTIAENGFSVDLIERTDSLGGNLKDIYSTLVNDDTQAILTEMIKTVEEENNITVHLNSMVQDLTGNVGEFQAIIGSADENKKTITEKYGAIVLATGANQYEPTEFLYGNDPRVLTQLELERALAGKALKDKDKQQVIKNLSNIKTITMIQCVGSRNDQHPYCSRVCCSKAIKNALRLKEQYPDIKIYILYQEIMTYGLQEKYYLDARAAGIEFVRYDAEAPPDVQKDDKSERLLVSIKDILLNQVLQLKPEMIILSTGIVPNTSGLKVFENLGMEYTNTKFIKEANVKFRPVDILVDGIFVAGLAHSPRQLSESVIQAQAAAGRVITILNKPTLLARRDVSEVNTRRCSGCGVCISACPYHARVLNSEEKVAVVVATLCQGCGVCTMVCPNGAATLKAFNRKQIYSMIDAAID